MSVSDVTSFNIKLYMVIHKEQNFQTPFYNRSKYIQIGFYDIL